MMAADGTPSAAQVVPREPRRRGGSVSTRDLSVASRYAWRNAMVRWKSALAA